MGSDVTTGRDVMTPLDSMSTGDGAGPLDAGSDSDSLREAGGDVACVDASGTPFPVTLINEIDSNGTTVTFPVGTLTAHGLLVLAVAFDQVNASLLQASDTEGNNFQIAVGPYYDTNIGLGLYILYAEDVSTSGAADTITVQISLAAQYTFLVYAVEYLGALPSGSFDVGAAASGMSSMIDGIQSGARTTTAPLELIFGFEMSGSGPGYGAAGTGFKARDTYNGNLVEDRTVGCIGSYEATATMASDDAGVTPGTMLMATFRGN